MVSKTEVQLPIKKYEFDGSTKVDFIIKNNYFIVSDNQNPELKKNPPLNKMELMILQTAFFMAHTLNQENKIYDAETEFKISVKAFSDLWRLNEGEGKISSGSLFTTLKRAIIKIDTRRFTYKDLNAAPGTSSTVLSGCFGSVKFISCKESGAHIAFSFPRDLIPYLISYGQFTWYYFENNIQLRDYPNAFILYELFSKEKNRSRIKGGKLEVDFAVDYLRKKLNISNSYDVTDFSRTFLKPSIEKINTKTTLTVEGYEPIKNGKLIEGFRFKLEFQEADLNFANACKVLNDSKPYLNHSQRIKFAYNLATDDKFKSLYMNEGESVGEFKDRLVGELENNEKVFEWNEFLKMKGYRNQKISDN